MVVVDDPPLLMENEALPDSTPDTYGAVALVLPEEEEEEEAAGAGFRDLPPSNAW